LFPGKAEYTGILFAVGSEMLCCQAVFAVFCSMVDYWFSTIKSRKTFLERQGNVLKFRYPTSSEKNALLFCFSPHHRWCGFIPKGCIFVTGTFDTWHKLRQREN